LGQYEKSLRKTMVVGAHASQRSPDLRTDNAEVGKRDFASLDIQILKTVSLMGRLDKYRLGWA
jgi:hypothetical protein